MKNLIKKIIPKQLLEHSRYINNSKRFTYNHDGLYTTHNSNFKETPKFKSAYNAGEKTGSWGESKIEWRAHVALWAAQRGLNLEGDFVECGVNKGGLSRAIVDYTNFKDVNKKFYLFDTFEGFDEKYLSEKEKKTVKKTEDNYGGNYEEIKNEFKDFKNVEIIKGSVPETLTQVQIDKVAYLSIDMNCVKPEIDALDYFWPKLSKGAAIVLDDYGFMDFIDQYEADNEWAKRNNIEILSLPTGQGLIIK